MSTSTPIGSQRFELARHRLAKLLMKELEQVTDAEVLAYLEPGPVSPITTVPVTSTAMSAPTPPPPAPSQTSRPAKSSSASRGASGPRRARKA